jgi:chemotaxis-related protein WspD
MNEDSANPGAASRPHTILDLLERPAPEGYAAEWLAVLGETKDSCEAATVSVLVFRLHGEWLAFRTEAFREAVGLRVLHSVPHRSNKVMLGLVNIRGEILLCFSLATLLGIEDEGDSRQAAIRRRVYPRMAVIEKEGARWVFPITEILGTMRLREDAFEPVPVNIAVSNNPFTSKIFRVQDKPVGLLDDDLIFYKLRKDYL